MLLCGDHAYWRGTTCFRPPSGFSLTPSNLSLRGSLTQVDMVPRGRPSVLYNKSIIFRQYWVILDVIQHLTRQVRSVQR